MSEAFTKTGRRELLKFAAAGTAGATLASLDRRFAFAQDAAKNRASYKVFSPGRIGKLKLKNRIVRSATWESAASNGEVTGAFIGIYRALAEGGVAMIISGYMGPYNGTESLPSAQINCYDDRFIPGLKKVADAVRGTDCRLVAQLGHAGATIGPSDLTWPKKQQTVKGLSTAQVEEIIGAFANGIRRIKEAGWDGVELHGAHSYLLCSFLSPFTNQRSDKYGGSTENRVRIIKDIITQARTHVEPDFPITIKANCNDGVEGGITLDTWPEQAKALVRAGVTAIDISSNNPMPLAVDAPNKESYHLKGALAIADIGVPIICTGGNRQIDRMEALLQTNGKVDFLGLARPLVREPGLPKRWLEGKGDATAKCIYCNSCLGALGKGPVHCVQETQPAA